jgi:hypothetical protein
MKTKAKEMKRDLAMDRKVSLKRGEELTLNTHPFEPQPSTLFPYVVLWHLRLQIIAG